MRRRSISLPANKTQHLQDAKLFLLIVLISVALFFGSVTLVGRSPPGRPAPGPRAPSFPRPPALVSVFKNGDFSRGLEHWCGADGGVAFPETKGSRTIVTTDVRSPPGALRVRCATPPCRTYVCTRGETHLAPDPYRDGTDIWLGVDPGAMVELSLWHKRAAPTIWLYTLRRDGHREVLFQETSVTSSVWRLTRAVVAIPRSAGAIALEITMNSLEPELLIDDVLLRVLPAPEQPPDRTGWR